MLPDPITSGNPEGDHHLLACRIEFMVTGDRELLGLGEFRGIRIVAPREFELLFQ